MSPAVSASGLPRGGPAEQSGDPRTANTGAFDEASVEKPHRTRSQWAESAPGTAPNPAPHAFRPPRMMLPACLVFPGGCFPGAATPSAPLRRTRDAERAVWAATRRRIGGGRLNNTNSIARMWCLLDSNGRKFRAPGSPACPISPSRAAGLVTGAAGRARELPAHVLERPLTHPALVLYQVRIQAIDRPSILGVRPATP